jgi:hypothetical protein
MTAPDYRELVRKQVPNAEVVRAGSRGWMIGVLASAVLLYHYSDPCPTPEAAWENAWKRLQK